MRVIGTAGHVDHGKSSLVRALTGINPDRLREEQAREMTIDLGFAWLTLPSGEPVSIVDVPGHEDFIQNMLAGVGGIDAAILVIAADEGVMPQTREHMAILDLLKVKTGLVALTKTDLVNDPEWLELVQIDVAELLEGTALAQASIIPVSARTRRGLNEVLAELDRVLRDTPMRLDLGRPRLSIDRVFTMAGFGTVVTGTLNDGRLRAGEEVEILPQGLRARIRSLQTHKTKLETAVPGSRVAVNLSGVSIEQLSRGNVIVHPGSMTPTRLADARVQVLGDVVKPLQHHMDLKFFCGAAQVPVRARVLGCEEIGPGEFGWVQLDFADPVTLSKNDRFVLRQPSPGLTIGGGIVVDPHPQRRHRRFRAEILSRLETLAHGTPEEILLEALRRREPCSARELIQCSGLAAEVARATLLQLCAAGQVIIPNGEAKDMPARDLTGSAHCLISVSGWAALVDRALDLVQGYHRQFPLRMGMLKEELRSRLRVDTRFFNDMVEYLADAGRLVSVDGVLRLPEHQVRFSPQQKAAVDALLAAFARNPYTPPTIAEAQGMVDAEVFNSIVEQGLLVKMDETICFLNRTYETMVKGVVSHLTARGSLSVGDARDMFHSSRKYVLPFLDYLDQRRITRRVGDDRVLR